MDIEQLKEWCKEEAESYQREMHAASERNDKEYYTYCDGMQYAFLSIYRKIDDEQREELGLW